MDNDICNYNVTSFPGNIYIIRDLIDDTFCENMRNIIDEQSKYTMDTYSPGSNVICNAVSLLNLSTDDILIKQNISLFLTGYVRAIVSIINHIDSRIFSNFIPTISQVELRRIYGATREHIDGIDTNSPRILTCIILLNDDYDDGIFSFPTLNVTFKPKKGDIILFPPYWTHPHCVSTPTNGFRYTINFWYNHSTASQDKFSIL